MILTYRYKNITFAENKTKMEQNINEQIKDLAFLLKNAVENYKNASIPRSSFDERVFYLINNSDRFNPWHIPEHVIYALEVLTDDLYFMTSDLELRNNEIKSRIGILMREGSPLEGLSELIYLSCSGFECIVRDSTSINELFKITLSLFEEFPCIYKRIHSTDSRFTEIDGLVAFEDFNLTQKEYFSKYALLNLAVNGYSFCLPENDKNLPFTIIAELICMYFGRSNQNIKVLFVPEGFDYGLLLDALTKYSGQLFHNRYYNNYEYRKATLIFNKIPFIPDYPIIITGSPDQAGYVSVLCIQIYKSFNDIKSNTLIQKYPLLNNYTDTSLITDIAINLSSFKKNKKKIDEYKGMLLMSE